MSHILIPVDGSSCALEAVKAVIRDSTHDVVTEVHLVNVQPRLPRDITRFARHQDVDSYQLERADEALRTAVDLLRDAGMPYSVHVRKGHVADAIVACCRETKCQKIVIGTARKNALARFFEGSIINTVIACADVPVEVVAREKATFLERYGLPLGLGAGLMLLLAVSE